MGILATFEVQNYSTVKFNTPLVVKRITTKENFDGTMMGQKNAEYQETFAYVGKCPEGKKNYLALWHEATAGRKWEQIASAFYSFLKSVKGEKALKLLKFWLDNCTGQNKN